MKDFLITAIYLFVIDGRQMLIQHEDPANFIITDRNLWTVSVTQQISRDRESEGQSYRQKIQPAADLDPTPRILT